MYFKILLIILGIHSLLNSFNGHFDFKLSEFFNSRIDLAKDN